MFFSIPKLQEKLNDTQILRDSSDPEFMMLSLWLHWHCDSSRWIFCGWLKNIGFIHVIDIIIHITIYIMIHILYIYTYIYLYIIVILGICRICRYITFIPPSSWPWDVSFHRTNTSVAWVSMWVGKVASCRSRSISLITIRSLGLNLVDFSWFVLILVDF